MAAVLRLFIHGGVPIGIVKDDVACACEIEPDAAGTSAADEAEDARIVVKPFDDGLPEFCLGVTVQAHVVELEHVEYLFEYVEHLGHLGEDEHFLSAVFDRPQQEDHLDQLATVVKDYVLVREVQQESRPDAFKLSWNYSLQPIPQILQPIALRLDLRTHRKSGQTRWPRHDLGHHEQVFLKYRLEFLSSLGYGFIHVVGDFPVGDLEFAKLEAVEFELFTF